MHSLFLKIFLVIWASLILLGATLFVVERQLGGEVLEQGQQWLEAHADTAASLYQQDGVVAIQRWLRGLRQTEERHILLINEQGQPVMRSRLMHGRTEWPPGLPSQPGIHHQHGGQYHLVTAIAQTEPPLYLATRIDLGRLRSLGPAARIALALLISALLSLLLAYLLSRRLRRLRQTVQRMAAGDLQVRNDSRGSDEIAALGRDVDQMAGHLQAMLRNQQTLLRDVSHELRSPLARLRVALELAEKNGDLSRALSRINHEADVLENLVSDLLSLARLDADNVLQHREPVDLAPLLQALVRDARFEAEANDRQIALQMPSGMMLEGDAVLLRSALENVVRNAIRHTAEHTRVDIEVKQQNTEIRIAIGDRGDGVPHEALQRIFEPFTRVAEARDRVSGGHGLGLAIAARIIAAHQGHISAHNRQGGGLCIEIVLPALVATG